MKRQTTFLAHALSLAISVAIGLLLQYFSVTSTTWTIAFAVLTFLIGLILTISLQWSAWPPEVLRLRKQLTSSRELATRIPPLFSAYRETMKEFHSRVAELRQGQYTDTRPTVPDLSIELVAGLRRSGLVTYIADRRQTIYQDPQGHRYMETWFATARGGHLTLKRLFILEELRSCSPELLAFMKRHIDSKIEVFVISRSAATDIAGGKSLDFGLFDDNCVMIVSRVSEDGPVKLSMYVTLPDRTNDAIICDYKDTWGRLTANAMPFASFVAQFVAPVNADYWNRWHLTEPARIQPPLGLSESDATAIVKSAMANVPGPEIDVGVLGLTVALREALGREAKVRNVVLLDQSAVETPQVSIKEIRVCTNWLSHSAKVPYSAVVGDEAINNLRLSQYALFFRNLAANMSDGALLVMRVLGQFGDLNEYISMPANEIIRKIILNDRLSPMTRKYVSIHNANICFEQETSEIDNRRFNSFIHTLVSDRRVSVEQAQELYFPSESPSRIILTSPSPQQIEKASSPFFSLLPYTRVDDGYCSDPLFHSFYRVLAFRKNTGTTVAAE